MAQIFAGRMKITFILVSGMVLGGVAGLYSGQR
jgi:hypothetical protein